MDPRDVKRVGYVVSLRDKTAGFSERLAFATLSSIVHQITTRQEDPMVLRASFFATMSLLFCTGAAQAESNYQGVYVDFIHAQKKSAFTSFVLGETAGTFMYIDAGKEASCIGAVLRVESEEQAHYYASAAKDFAPVGPCPEDLQLDVSLDAEGNATAVFAYDDSQREFVLNDVVLAPETERSLIAPEGADVLGVELGMTLEQAVQKLVDENGFHQSAYEHTVEFVNNIEAEHRERSISRLTDFREYVDDEFYTVLTETLSETQKLRTVFFTATEVAATAADIDRSEHVALMFAGDKIVYIRRQLQFDPSAIDAVLQAMDEKYGSLKGEDYYELRGLLNGHFNFRDGWSSVHGDFYRLAGVYWGGAVYDLDGVKLDEHAAKLLRNKPGTGSNCAMSHQLSPYFHETDTFDFLLPAVCASGTFFSLLENGWAQISVYEPVTVTDTALKAFLGNYDPAWNVKANYDSDYSDFVAPNIPKL